jgi:PST family polysaccharide transporter
MPSTISSHPPYLILSRMNLSALRARADRNSGDRFLILRNLIFNGALQASTYVLGFVTVPYLTRTLGPADYGALAFTISLNAYGWMLVDWGFSTGATREVAAHRQDPEKLRSVFWNVLSAKLILALVSAVALTAFTLWNRSPGPAVTLAPVLINLVGVLLSMDWFVQGFEKMGWYAATTIGGRTATFALLLFLVHRPQDVWIAAILQAMTGLFGSIAGLMVVRRLLKLGPPHVSLKAGLAKIRNNRHYFLINGNALLYSSAAPIALNLLAGTAAVGFYAAADKLMRVAFTVMTPAATVMYPRTVSLMSTDRRAAARTAGRAFLLQLPIAVGLGAGMFFGADLLTRGLLGTGMAPAAVVLRWLAATPVISLFNRVLTSQMLYPLGYAAEAARAVYLSTPLYLVSLAGLGWAMGPAGAAIAFTLTEASQVGLFAYAVWRKDRAYLLDACTGLNPLHR